MVTESDIAKTMPRTTSLAGHAVPDKRFYQLVTMRGAESVYADNNGYHLYSSGLPAIAHRVRDYLFAVFGNGNGEFNRLRIHLFERLTLGGNLPS